VRQSRSTTLVGAGRVRSSGSAPGRLRTAVYRRTGDSLGKFAVIALLLSTVATAFVLASVERTNGLSPLDEYTHLDWVYQLEHGTIPRDGDDISAPVLADWACVGQWNVKQMPPCGETPVPEEFPNGGEQYNAFHPPLYYAITAGLVRIGEFFVGDEYFLALARSTGALWLAAAMVLLYAAGRTWRLGTLYAVAGPLLLLTLPRILNAATTVSNDAPAALAGAYAVYWLGRFRVARTVDVIGPAVLTLLFSATKTLNALPMLLIAAGLIAWGLAAAVRRQRTTAWRRLRAAVIVLAPAALFYLAWTRFQRGRTVPDWVNPIIGQNTRDLVQDPLTSWVASLPGGFDLIRDVNLLPELRSNYFTGWNTGISVLLAASSLLALVVYRRGARRRWPAILLLAGCALFPLLVQIQAMGLGDTPQYFPDITRRYGMSLLPLAVFCLAMVADSRRLRRTGVGIVGVGLIIAAGSTFGFLVP
jgi:hypothetical protein